MTITQARINTFDYIEMLYVKAIGSLNLDKNKESNKTLTVTLIEQFLKKRGYTNNNVLGREVLIKGFVCADVKDNYVEVWHDIPQQDKSIFINESILTGLPITLKYMERI